MSAGNEFGVAFFPRIGQEVLVAFVDGDPDRPLCVGSLYNSDHLLPIQNEGERTKSIIRTQSTPGGGGFNELSFEDAAGSEEVYLRAQRNLRTQVLANESRTVGHDQSVHIGHDQTVSVSGDQALTVKGNQAIKVEGGGTEGVAGSAIEVKGNVDVKVTGTGWLVVDALEGIELRVGETRIVIDGTTIQLQAGGGTICRLDAAASLVAGKGALLRMGSSVMMNAASGATLQMDGKAASLTSNAGSQVLLTDGVGLQAGLGGKLDLTADAALEAASIAANASQGASLALDANASICGAEVSQTGAGGKLTIGPSGAVLDGTTVEVSAATMATVASAMVKIN
jgi:type VI secretion system secreted protein VgrG